jgi:hypothetical protein
MRASRFILGAALALLLLVIIYAVVAEPEWAQKTYWTAHYVENPWRVYQRSDGTFDDAAALALRRATGRAAPTPGDHILSATVITRNILSQEHRPERDRTGAPTRAALEQAHLRREMFDEARGHYMAALTGLGPRHMEARVGGAAAEEVRAAAAEEARGGAGTNEFDTNIEFIIDAAVGFAFGGLHELLANDPILAGLGWDFNNLTIFEDAAVDQTLAATAAQRREDLVRERRAAAKAAVADQGGVRGAGVAAYVELATQNTDDPQNTHDTGVLACLKAIVERLRADQAGAELPSPDAVAAEIRDRAAELSEGRAHRVADVEAVIARTRAGERVVAIGATDAECLGRVWLRAADPRNVAVRGQLRRAVFDALYDCWEDGIVGRKIVCVNGRTSRILAALILLDWDTRNWEVKKLEQFKNDIFAKAATVIAAEAATAAASDDPEMRRAGRLHLARTTAELSAVGDVSDAVAERLAGRMRDAIGAMVDAHVRELEDGLGVKGAIPAYLVAAVAAEAQAAVG